MHKYMRLQDPAEPRKALPELRLWCAVLKRALDDIAHYKPNTREYEHAFEWLTTPGDENQSMTLANVLANITPSTDLQRTVIKQIQALIFDKDKIIRYRVACISGNLHALIGRTSRS